MMMHYFQVKLDWLNPLFGTRGGSCKQYHKFVCFRCNCFYYLISFLMLTAGFGSGLNQFL